MQLSKFCSAKQHLTLNNCETMEILGHMWSSLLLESGRCRHSPGGEWPHDDISNEAYAVKSPILHFQSQPKPSKQLYQ